GIDSIEIATPPIPQNEEWSTIEKLNKERDLVGIYLSAHPLDEYNVVLSGLCNTRCKELDDKPELAKKEVITVGGIVTNVKERIAKNGNRFGIVTIEDYDDSGELAVFGEDWGTWKGMLSEGNTIYITAKCTQRFRDSNSYSFNITDIKYLQTVKEQQLERITISMPVDDINEQVAEDLSTLVSNNPGNAELCFRFFDATGHQPILVRSKNHRVDINKELIQYIQDHSFMSFSIN
ncbi:MAG: DNA polymerase III subunit alpha, partial [Prevotella sp.]|nr:DNA polymerase III subunit alpha [Prevotella sp.]